MLRRNRIPEKDIEFSRYIYNTTAALLSGTPVTWQRLNLSEEDKNTWINYMNQWDDIYPKYNSRSTRTAAITADKNAIRKAFIKFAQPLLTRMGHNSAATSGDRLTFNLRKKERNYHRRSKIEDVPEVNVQATGSSQLKIRVRRQNQDGRRGKHPQADVFEVVYWYGHRVQSVPIEQCVHKSIFTKTYFIMQLPYEASGKWAYFYFRWVNLRKPQNNGPYTDMHMTVVV